MKQPLIKYRITLIFNSFSNIYYKNKQTIEIECLKEHSESICSSYIELISHKYFNFKSLRQAGDNRTFTIFSEKENYPADINEVNHLIQERFKEKLFADYKLFLDDITIIDIAYKIQRITQNLKLYPVQ